MTQMSIAEAIRQGIREEMQRDPLVFCIGEDIGIPGGFGGAFTVTLGLSDEFGHERILDTPISELGLAGVAVGAAMAGLRPIADVQYSDFLFLAMDQLVNNAAKMTYMSGGVAKVPMVMRAPVGATARGSQHAQSMEAFFCHVPGLKVVAPATAYDAKSSSTSCFTAPKGRAPSAARSVRWVKCRMRIIWYLSARGLSGGRARTSPSSASC
jgi:acetoin:2,6-dichlorophenolindophenol oxidoreductase subunit beta